MTANPFLNSSKRPRVAVVGAGISGLSSAYHLHQQYDVTVYEKNDYLGGHTDTHEVEINGRQVRIDSGFIIFCPQYYPHFSAMLNELGVQSKPTNMSFSANNPHSGVLYNATTINTLFCDRANLLRPKFWRMLFDIVRFYRNAPKVLKALETGSSDTEQTVEDYLNQHGYSLQFREDHLLPMISALWSATPERVKLFPIAHLVDFFQRHGLMKLIGRPQWLVVKNGSASYVEELQKQLTCDWKLNQNITNISRSEHGVNIQTADGHQEQYDSVIMATHADTALRLLGDASAEEQHILGAIPFEKNHVVMHTDETIMPSNKRAWASWNTDVPHEEDQNTLRCCTANYWMNLLQGLSLDSNVFTTLNSGKKINPDKVLVERHYSHPVFTAESVSAQKKLPQINGMNHTYYVGAYWGWGFHEDGARSAYNACQILKKNLIKPIIKQTLGEKISE